MKSVPNLQEIVTQIARKHGVDLSMPGAYLRLAIPGNQLILESMGNRISLSLCHKEWTEWRLERVTLWINGIRWYPIETIDHIGRWYLYGEVSASAAGLDLYDSEGQHELVELAEYVAQQLINDGWLENGLRPNSSPTVYG